jgi:hypothetical protein
MKLALAFLLVASPAFAGGELSAFSRSTTGQIAANMQRNNILDTHVRNFGSRMMRVRIGGRIMYVRPGAGSSRGLSNSVNCCEMPTHGKD